MTVALPPRTLPDEMAYLLPTTAPDVWRAAVARAAQLLAPTWDDRPGDIGALSFVLLTLSVEREEPPQSIPLAVTAEYLRAQGREPEELSRRIEAAGQSAGVLGVGDGSGPLDRLWRNLSSWLEAPGEPMGDAPGQPPVLWTAVRGLHDVISSLDEADIRQTPVPLPSLSTLTVLVSRYVQIVTARAIRPVKCDTCTGSEGGVLRVDGPEVTFVCAEGHTTAHDRLEVRRVRNALAYAGVPIGAAVAVEGDLPVTSSACGERSDPRHLSRFTADLLA
ncbi:hypothetical protein [Streptomyces sp. NPDC046909]|uniref:hypothetical protein n=1 Tax=Streptomyces sp. NPDC046909 TaxID=3155617 RepID=UPI0033D4B28C